MRVNEEPNIDQEDEHEEYSRKMDLTEDIVFESYHDITKGPGSYWLNIEEGGLLTKAKLWLQRKNVSDEDLELLKKLAWKLSRIFPHRILAQSTQDAISSDKANPVHGYILLNHPKRYRELIFDNRVIDLACLYGIRNFRPDILKFLTIKELKNLQRSIIYTNLTPLENYPEIKFSRMIVYTRQNFYDSVSVEHRADIEINGWPSLGKKVYSNGALLSFVDYDLPMVLITHTPGDTDLYQNYNISSEELQDHKEQILTKLYHKTLGDLSAMEKQLDKAEAFASSFARVASHTIKEAERKHNIDWVERINLEEKKQKEDGKGEEKRVKDWTNIIIAIIGVIGILTGLGLVLTFLL